MFGNKLKDIKEIIDNKYNKDNKRKMENMIVLIIILIVTIFVINIIWNGDKKENTENSNLYKQLASSDSNNVQVSSINENDEYNLEKSLENILSKINGAGNVQVLLTYSESSQVVPLTNDNYTQKQTEETDTSGGNRKIDETSKSSEIIYEEKDGEKSIITKKVIMPKVEGALILADGASNATVKTNIIQAVEALTGIATHKIQVLEMQK